MKKLGKSDGKKTWGGKGKRGELRMESKKKKKKKTENGKQKTKEKKKRRGGEKKVKNG